MFFSRFQKFSPRRDIDFNIELGPETIPMSKDPCRMGILHLKELKIHIQEILKKGYIVPSLFPLG